MLRPGEVAWGFIQSGLENLQGQKLHNLSVQPVPQLHRPYGEKDVLCKNDEMPDSVLCTLRSFSSGEEEGKVSPSSHWPCWKPCRAWWWVSPLGAGLGGEAMEVRPAGILVL